jgi:hypothetical protein
MVSDWRGSWGAGTPFVFVQIASWPANDNGLIATQRYAQQAVLALPATGMVVAADRGDASGAFHPIHPPWKAEVGRRASLIYRNLVYGDKSIPTQGPVVKAVALDAWSPSWGDFHYGYGGAANVCTQFLCAGLRVTFDQPLVVAPSYGQQYGFTSGFELFSDASNSSFVQPATLTGVRADDPTTLQLNFTWTVPPNTVAPTVLKLGWHDYPNLFLYNALGQPAPPFNITLPPLSRSGRVVAVPRPY